MSKKDSKEQQKFISLIFRRKEVFKHLNTGYIDERVSCIREYAENTYFYTAVFINHIYYNINFHKPRKTSMPYIIEY